MAEITFLGKALKIKGALPAVGSIAPAFTLTKSDLTEITQHDFKSKKLVLNIFPSLDTPTCATAVRKFNEGAGQITNSVVLCVSADLPFAHKRFCTSENLQHVVGASTFRHPEFGQDYGVTIIEGPLAGLLSRAVVVLDENGKVLYTEQVAELSHEPDYETVLSLL